MFLVVGLGNPGLKYQCSRHNFGFLLADQIIENYQLQLQGIKFGGQVFVGKISDQRIILIKPQNYMNNSGGCVLEAAQFYKIPANNIIILHDDLDLALGKIKAKVGGGNGGHNGLKDIDEKIGKNYCRIRLGIGRPENPDYEVADYVLGKFSKDDLAIVGKVNEKICKIFPLILENNLPQFLNKILTP